MTTRLIVIRHAQSLANAEGRIQGHLDIALSELGRRQSEGLAARLAASGVDALYSTACAPARLPTLAARPASDRRCSRAASATSASWLD
jgi:broad specificity phosphatase PhoE